MASKRILITGVAGFLGSHLADAFIKEGHSVVGCDNLMSGKTENVPGGVEFFKYDCNSLSSMSRLAKDADVVYHCAAAPYEGLSIFSPSIITKHIVTASVTTMTAAIKGRVKRFVYCSSMARYGDSTSSPFTEDMEPAPCDPYGIGKYAGELYLRNLSEIHGLDYVIAVPHNIIGPRQRYDDPYRNVAGIMINLMLQNRQPVIYGKGTQQRSFTFVSDVVKILTAFAFSQKARNEVFNVGPDTECITINELASRIASLLDFNLRPKYLAERPCDVACANCSAEKIRSVFGYRPDYNLDKGLREMIDWIRLKGAKPFNYHLNVEIPSDACPVTWKERIL